MVRLKYLIWHLLIFSILYNHPINAQSSVSASQKCLKLWKKAMSENTFQSYKYFYDHCEDEKYIKIADLKIRELGNGCNSCIEKYKERQDKKYLAKYIDGCGGYDTEKMRYAIRMYYASENNKGVLNKKLDMELKFGSEELWLLAIIAIGLLLIIREIRKGVSESGT